MLLLLLRAIAVAYADCSCPPAKPEEFVDQASYVFQGKLYDLRKNKKSKEQRLVFEYFETYKGDLKEDTPIKDETVGTDCAIPFKEGEIYLIYARWEAGITVIKPCSGTKLIKQTANEEASAVGPSDEYKGKLYDTIQKLCMGRRETLCCLNSLKAMKAGKHLPEPDEGCPEDMRPDRLSCLGSLVWCVPIIEKK